MSVLAPKNDLSISATTNLYCLFGKPVSHSMGPLVHNMLFNHLGVNSVYLAFEIDDIKKGIESIRTLGIKGVSVTIPFKAQIMEHLDKIDDMASKIGAVNTVINQNGHLWGCNTDCAGAIEPLKEAAGAVTGKNVCIIGAGGAARAVAFGMKKEGADITIVNRTPEKGIQLARQTGGQFLPYSFLNTDNSFVDIGDSLKSNDSVMAEDSLKSGDGDNVHKKNLLPKELLHNFDILINTTSLGMTPNVDKSPVDSSFLHENMTVMDIVYNPLKTQLLKDAEHAGCQTVDGLAMFIHQGAAQFELFTGVKPPRQLMREVILKKMAEKQ